MHQWSKVKAQLPVMLNGNESRIFKGNQQVKIFSVDYEL